MDAVEAGPHVEGVALLTGDLWMQVHVEAGPLECWST